MSDIPTYEDLLRHARKHTEALFSEAVTVFGSHGGEMTAAEEKMLRSVQDMCARQLLIRYGREAALRRVRGVS